MTHRRLLALPLALLLAAGPALAQETPAPGGEAAPAPETKADPAAVEDRMADLFGRVAGDPPSIAPGADPKTASEFSKRKRAYDDALAALSSAADEYVKAGGASPRALWWGGYAKVRRGDRVGGDEAGPERRTGLDLLRKAVDGAPADAEFRADAEFWLGRTGLVLAETGGPDVDASIASLRAAALAFRKAGRADDAGAAVSAALQKLLALKRDADARDLSKATDALGADFGRRTDVVRALARRAATGVGEVLPDLPDGTDADGKPVVWKELRGSPLVIHFFRAGWATGRASGERDVETVLRPLWDRLGSKGLRIVGVSMDLALTKEQVEKIRKDWEEWGVKNPLQDGSRESVRRYADDQGIAWPWLWDGLWTKNPVSVALGGAGANAAHAILVDAGGVIRWRGDAPFAGLPEACDTLVK